MKLEEQETQLKERMEKSSVALNYKGNLVFYIIKSLDCVGKLNKAMTGGELLFKKFAGLLVTDLEIMSEQLKLVDSADTPEDKTIFWKDFFESNSWFLNIFLIKICNNLGPDDPDMVAGIYYAKMHYLANTLNPVINRMVQMTLTPEAILNDDKDDMKAIGN